MIDSMSKISDFASNSIMGVVRKIVNHIVDNVDPQISDATDHLPARFSGTFNDATRNLTMTIESQGASAENLVATVNIPAGGGGSGGPTYSAGNGINITPENAIEIDPAVTATKQSVDTLQAQVGDAFSQVAIGADGKSLDFTALDGQVNNIVLPTGGESQYFSRDTWTNIYNMVTNNSQIIHVMGLSSNDDNTIPIVFSLYIAKPPFVSSPVVTGTIRGADGYTNTSGTISDFSPTSISYQSTYAGIIKTYTYTIGSLRCYYKILN